jgi:hypothetical protein
MSTRTAGRIADALLAAGAAAAVWLMLRRPDRRRAALALMWGLAARGVPRWLAAEIRSAWRASGRRPAERAL